MSKQSYEQGTLFLDKTQDKNSISNKFIINNSNVYYSLNNSMNISKSYIKYKEKFIKLTYCQRLYSRLIIKGSSNIIKLYKKSIGLIEQ